MYETQGHEMKFPIIRVRKKDTGDTHIVGTDIYDKLYIESFSIRYINQRRYEYTGIYGDYDFVGIKKYEFRTFPNVELVALDELLETYAKETDLSAEQENMLRDFIKAFRAEK